ncbi:MAG TPA: glycosyltransferase family 4 protein [Pyrinomonadaceae bacterium]|nr:glycosyltransferase family 4 protein [Pyrinomonadaceae bacterium]
MALVPSQQGYSPGQRGSIELWEKVLEPEGVSIDFAPFESEKLREILYRPGNQLRKAAEMFTSYGRRIRLLERVNDFDAVFIYREAALLGPAFLERMIARKKPIIYQLDDPLFVPYRSPANGLLSYLKFFGKVKEIVRMSSAVLVNSGPIREFAEQYNKNVWQVPSVVDIDKFVYRESDQLRRPVCVGWSGSPTTIKNLKMIEEPLARISNDEECDISLIGSDDFGLTGVRHKAKRWSGETEVEDLRRIQIGLVPLPDDNPWNPYKFIMKTAQYMSLGIVPVGTPMASNTEVIRHGENGFLASNGNEWADAISTLIHDEKLRCSMSSRAASDAAEKYSLQANAGKIVAAFRSAVG